jgi:hypothetical protein
MKEFLARLNSTERRFVVGVFVIIIIVINVLFIWPRFKDWEETKTRMFKARRTLNTFNKEIGQMKANEAKVKAMESESASVPPEDQLIEFQTTVNNQAAASHVSILNWSRHPAGTNQFFVEHAQTIAVLAEESQLVDFLYNLGAGNSLIRARGLRLNPDPPRQKLSGSITLVASYQKRTAVRSATTSPAAAKTATPTKK